MASRFEFDDFLEPLDSERPLNEAMLKEGFEAFEKSSYSQNQAPDILDPAANSQQLSHLHAHFPEEARNNSSYAVPDQRVMSSTAPAELYLDNEPAPPPMKHTLGYGRENHNRRSQDAAKPNLWIEPPADDREQAGFHVAEKAPPIASPLGDPVINVFAPDEVAPENKPYADSIFPMYSVDGTPIYGSQLPEFQQGGGPDVQQAHDIPVISPGLASPTSPTSAGHTPYGTPQTSPFIVPGSPNAASSVGSPLIGNDPSQFQFNDEGDLGPLIDDNQPLFDFNTLTPSSSLNTPTLGYTPGALGVPSSSRKSRALSDTWSAQERDAFLESLDAQMQLNQQARVGSSQSERPDADTLLASAASTIQFPSYSPVYVKDAQNMQYGGAVKGSERRSGGSSPVMIGADPRRNSGHIPRDLSSDEPPAGPKGSSGAPNQLAVPVNGRGRSLSNPYDSTNDLKAAQMFSCELCGKRFTRAYNLRSHMRTHTDERPFACQHCGKAFARQHDRKRHEALHSGEKRFVCHGLTHGFQWGCRKRFARADALGRHFRTEAGKNCLRPLIEQICANGSFKETAPEGIILNGIVDNQPQLVLSVPERESSQNISSEEREDQTRRTVIVTAVAEQFQELVGGNAEIA